MSRKIVLRFRKDDRRIFDAIRDGRKTVETRAATVRFGDIAAGDTLVMSCGGEKLEKRVGKATTFASAAEMLKTYPPSAIDPDAADAAALMRTYASFPGYAEKIEEVGIIAMEIS